MLPLGLSLQCIPDTALYYSLGDIHLSGGMLSEIPDMSVIVIFDKKYIFSFISATKLLKPLEFLK